MKRILIAACAILATSAHAQNWIDHRDAAGFSVKILQGWQVKAEMGRVNIAGPSLERVTIIPILVPGTLNQRTAKGLLLGLSKRFWSQQQWVMPENGWASGGNAVRSLGLKQQPVRESTVLWWVNTPKGAAGFFYRLAAAPARYAALQPVFARVLQSFRVTQAGPAPRVNRGSGDPLQGLRFQRWTDPNEGAYSFDAPVGWQVQGGMFRPYAGTGAVSQFVLTSPDNKVSVRFGDVQLPTTFIVPNETLSSLGYGEGSRPSNNSMVLRYMTGSDFAAYYARQSLQQTCSSLSLLERANHPEYVSNLVKSGLSNLAAHTAGDVSFRCEAPGGARLGYAFSETYAINYQGTGTAWAVAKLFGFLAAPEQNALGYAIVRRVLSSTRVNPQWYGGELRQQQRTAAMQQRYAEYTADLVQRTYEERGSVLDRQAEIRGDLLRGQEQVKDAETGQAYKVTAGSNYYWIDPQREVIAGTDLAYKPDTDWNALIRTYR